MTVASELRDLANAIEQCSHASPCMSVACGIVSVCCDHLRAIAAVHDKTNEIQLLQAEVEDLTGSLIDSGKIIS